MERECFNFNVATVKSTRNSFHIWLKPSRISTIIYQSIPVANGTPYNKRGYSMKMNIIMPQPPAIKVYPECMCLVSRGCSYLTNMPMIHILKLSKKLNINV